MNNRLLLLVVLTSPISVSCSNDNSTLTLTTIADARNSPAEYIDLGEQGDSVGDVLVFDQPLLDESGITLGNNSGSCVRTRVGHSFQCQWTLTFIEDTKVTGTIQIAGRELDQGTSVLSIVGGSGQYLGVRGEMRSTNNNDGTFTQVLIYTKLLINSE